MNMKARIYVYRLMGDTSSYKPSWCRNELFDGDLKESVVYFCKSQTNNLPLTTLVQIQKF